MQAENICAENEPLNTPDKWYAMLNMYAYKQVNKYMEKAHIALHICNM